MTDTQRLAQPDPLSYVFLEVQADVGPLEIAVHNLAVLFGVTRRNVIGDPLRSTTYIQVMFMDGTCFEHFILPVRPGDKRIVRAHAGWKYLSLISVPFFDNAGIIGGVQHIKLLPGI